MQPACCGQTEAQATPPAGKPVSIPKFARKACSMRQLLPYYGVLATPSQPAFTVCLKVCSAFVADPQVAHGMGRHLRVAGNRVLFGCGPVYVLLMIMNGMQGVVRENALWLQFTTHVREWLSCNKTSSR